MQDWKAFDAAEHLARDADTAWEAPKNSGNAALKDGKHLEAAQYYREAALLALGPVAGGTIAAFISSLEAYPEGSAQRQFVDNEDLLWLSLNLLPTPREDREMKFSDGHAMVGKYPNKGAAICWANRAQALLLAGHPKKALRSARRATEANPAYVKAHHRERKALEALGQTEAAAKIAEEMTDYARARSMYPCEAVALLGVGWISWDRSTLVYGPIRFQAVSGRASAPNAVALLLQCRLVIMLTAAHLRAARPIAFRASHQAADAVVASGEKKVEARASIVPYMGGQMMMLTLMYGLNETVECSTPAGWGHTVAHSRRCHPRLP